MISTGLYSCWATFCHNRQGYSATFLSVAFVTVMMVLVSAFDTDPQNLMRDERYGITLLRGAIEELIKVCSLLLFSAVPLSDKGKLATSLGNPIWILAILIASYENILLWAEPVATSVQVLLVTDGSAPDQFPAVMYCQLTTGCNSLVGPFSSNNPKPGDDIDRALQLLGHFLP